MSGVPTPVYEEPLATWRVPCKVLGLGWVGGSEW